MNEGEIIRKILAGEREEFAPLVRLYQVKVKALCLSILHDPVEAEDAAQEAFVKAFKSLKEFKGKSSFSTWLYRIAYRHCLDVLRAKNRRRQEPLEAAAQAPAPQGGAPEELWEAQKVLSRLPEDYRAALVLREIQGLTYEEIAQVTGTTLDSVKARLKRARKALIERLTPQDTF